MPEYRRFKKIQIRFLSIIKNLKHILGFRNYLLIGAVMILLALTKNVRATTYFSIATGNWSNATGTVWSLSSNGAAVAANVKPVAGDIVNIERGFTVTVDQNSACAQIITCATGNAVGNITMGGAFTLTVSGNITLGGPVNVARDATLLFANGSSVSCGSLTVGGTVGQGTVTMTAGGTLSVGGAITIGAGSGTWTPGTGTVIMTANNTLPATLITSFNNLTINGGTTTLGVAIPTVSGVLTVKTASTLALSTFALGATTKPSGLVMETGTSAGASITGSGVLNLANAGGITINTGGTGATAASITAPITLGGAQTITNNATEVSPSLTIGTGALTNGGNLLTAGGSGNTTISSVIGNGAGGIAKNGAGILTLSGANTYTGTTAVSAGKLKLGSTAALGVSSATTVTAGAALDLNGFTLSTARPLTLNGTGVGGLGALTNSGGAATYSGAITFATAASIVGESGTIAITGTPVSSAIAITLGGSAGGSVSTVIAGARTLTKGGTGTWTLSGVNTYTGATTISAGTLALDATGTIATSSGVANSGTLTIAANKTIGSMTGAGGTTLGANTLTIGDANNTTCTYAGVASGTGGITKAGTGTLTLSGASTYSGLTTISAGTLKLGASSALATQGPLGSTAGGTIVANNAALDLNGFSLTSAATEALSLTGTGVGSLGALTNSSTTASEYIGVITFEVDRTMVAGEAGTIAITGTIAPSTTRFTIGGSAGGSIPTVIAGNRIVVIDGTGTWVLSGDNTFTNYCWIRGGTLSVAKFANYGTACPIGAQAATPLYIAGEAPTYPVGTLLYTGSGETVNRGFSMDTGGNSIIDQSGASGLLKFTGTVAPQTSGTDPGPFSYTLTLQGSTAGMGELGGVVSNGTQTLGIAKSGTGTWTLSGNNTYTGATTVNAGTLLVNGTQTSSAVSLNGGTLGGTGSVGNITSTAAGGIISPGSPETSTGILNCRNVNLSAAGTRSFAVQLNGTTAGSGYDQLNVTGTVNLTGATLSGTVGLAPAVGSTFTIINNDGVDLVTGTFAGLVQGATVTLSGMDFTISYIGGTGNDVVLTCLKSTFTWDGGGGDNNWTTGANWVGNLAPGAGHDLVFDATGVGTRPLPNNDLTAGTSFATMTVSVGGYTIGGNSLSLSTGLTASNATGTSTVSLAVGGAGTVTKSGAGTFVLSGANSYTGATTISAGVLNIQHATALGTTAAGTSVAAGAALQIQGGITVGAEALTLNGTGVSANGALRNISGANVWRGTVTLGSAVRINSDAGSLTFNTAANSITATNQNLTLGGAGDGTVSGTITTGTGSFTKGGTGTWTLSGNNTYTGVTTINAGVLSVSTIGNGGVSGNLGAATNAAANLVLGGGTLQYTGASATTDRNFTLTAGTTSKFDISAGGTELTLNGGAVATTGALTKIGSGTLLLNAGNHHTGTTTIDAGTLVVDGDGPLAADKRLPSAAIVVINNGGTFEIRGDVALGSGAVLPVIVTVNSGGILNILSGTSTYGGTVSHTHLGNLTMAGGTLNMNYSGAGTAWDNECLQLDGSVSVTANSTIQFGTGATNANAGASLNGTITFTVDPGVTLNVNAELENRDGGVVGAITKAGTGTMVLTGDNTYTGATTVSAGVLNIQSATALGTTAAGTSVAAGAALQIQGEITVGAEALTLNGTGIAADGAMRNISGTNVWQGTVTLGSAVRINSDAGSLTFNTAANSITATNQNLTLGGAAGGTVSGTITTGSGTLTKDGAGTWTLSGANNYTGTTTVSEGVLNIQNATALGTVVSGTSVTAGAALQIQGGITVGAEALTLNGTGISTDGALRNISGANIWQGTVTLGSAVRINSDSGSMTFNTAANSITATNQNLTLGGAAGGTVSGTITTGSGTLTKDGGGTWTLSANNSYTGTTTVTAGTLLVNGSQGGSAVSLNGGTLGGSGTVGAITSTGLGGTLSPGSPETGPGILSSGNVDLSAAGTRSFAVQLNGSTAGTGYDQLNVTGTVDPTGATLSVTLGFPSVYGNTFTIINNDGADAVTGTFTGLAEGAAFTLSGYNFTISYTGGDGNDVVLTREVTTFTWDGGGGDNNWSTAANWVGDVVPLAGDDLVFDATGVAARPLPNNDFAAGTSFGTITVSEGGYTIGGNSVSLSTGLVASNASGASTVSLVIGGAGTVTKSGAGSLTLSGANSYTGTTTVSAGTLVAGSNAPNGANGAFGNASSAIILGDAGTTANNSSPSLLTGGAFTIGRPITVANQATSGTYSIGGNTDNNSAFSGAITINQPLSVTQAATTATNTLSITGGITTGNAGTKNVTFNNAGAVTVSTTAITPGTGNIAVVKQNSGTLTMNVANTYTGGTTLTAGTLELKNTAGLGAAGQAVTLSGGILDLDTDATVNAYNITVGGNATIESDRATSGAGITHVLGTLSIGANTLTINKGISVTSGTAAIQFGNLTLTGAATLNTGTANLLMTGSETGNFKLTKSGAGTLQKTTTGWTLAGDFEVTAGTYDANGQTTTVTGLATVSGGEYKANTAAQDFNGGLTVSGGTFTGLSGTAGNIVATNLTISSGTLVAPGSTGTFNVSGNWTNNGGTFTPGSGTVSFINAGTKNIHGSSPTTFNNLTVPAVGGMLNLGNGLTHTALTLSLGGYGRPAGSYGGTGSTATYVIPSFFEAATGLLNVGNSLCTLGTWTGSASTDWNDPANWSCYIVPDLTMNVVIPNVANKPLLNSGATGTAKDLTIDNGSSLTVDGKTLQIAGTIANSGTFTASNGTIEMKGSVAQAIPSGTFAGNNLLNLTINNAAGVTLGGTLNLTGVLTAQTGDLVTGGFLTLVSSAAQTALIDGSGSGEVTGNVTMQRYLPVGYGYKYLCSPFVDATVAQLSGYLSTTATIPTCYYYNENKTISGSDVTGWMTYMAGLLNNMMGYAANLGAGPGTKTIQLTGTVNNGPYSLAVNNNNRTFTKGFNLIGNPYPSPIDWDAVAGWTKTNIDNAIYFFDSNGGADEYSGVYCSYVGGVSSGGSTNLIPSMQAFFIHVSDVPLPYPVSGTIGMTNSVRTNDLSLTFKAATVDPRPILRFEAALEGKSTIKDASVIYFDPQAKLIFETEKDALKLMNTDATVPNIYSITPDARQLSISGMPVPTDSLTKIPMGIKILKDGWVNFNAKDISALPYGLNLYLQDKEKNVIQNLAINPSYRFYLQQGEYNQRFTLIFAKKEISDIPLEADKLFTIIRVDKKVMVKVNLPENEKGKLLVSNMSGLITLERTVTNLQLVDISSGVNNGIYAVTMTSGERKQAEKTIIMH